MTSVLRAHATGETRGFMKMLLEADSDRILGLTMLGADAGEVLAVVQTAMLAGNALHRPSRRDPHAPDDGRRIGTRAIGPSEQDSLCVCGK